MRSYERRQEGEAARRDRHPSVAPANAPAERDPFDDGTDAQASDFEVRERTWGVESLLDASPEQWAEKTSKPKARAKKTDLNPMQRRWFEQHGWTYARVEHANAFGAVNVDLWGVADYLACKPGEGVMLVQVTTGSGSTGGGHAANRERKARKAPELAVWLASGGRFEVHAWKQPGGPGTRWEMTRRPMEVNRG